MEKKKITAYDVISCISSFVALIPNFIVFLIMFIEQIETGWGFPTRYEMLVILFWLFQSISIPFLAFGLVGIIIELIKKRTHGVFVASSIAIALTLILGALSVLFEFN